MKSRTSSFSVFTSFTVFFCLLALEVAGVLAGFVHVSLILMLVTVIVFGSALKFTRTQTKLEGKTWWETLGVRNRRDMAIFLSVVAITVFVILILVLSLGGVISIAMAY